MKRPILIQPKVETGYAGPKIHGRFQVSEREGKGQGYFITRFLDEHTKIGVVFRRDGEQLACQTIKEAEAIALQWSKNPVLGSGDIMVPTPSARGAKPVKPFVEKKPAKPSMAGYCRELIQEGKLTDDQIFDKVLAAFPNFRRTSVDWYRKELASKKK